MKIGILLIGQVRNFDITVDFLNKEFDIPGVEVDYFCHTWDSVANFSPWNNMKTTDERFSDLKKHDKEELIKTINLCNVKKYEIESYDSLEYLFENVYHPEHHTEKNIVHQHFCHEGWKAFDSGSTLKYSDWTYFFSLLGQFYSTKRALDMLCEYEKENNTKYDVIIRWRYDLISDITYRTMPMRMNQWCETPLEFQNADTVFFNCLNIWNGMHCSGDHYWYGCAGAFKSFTSNFDTKYLTTVRSKIMTDKTVLNENIMQDIIIQQKMSSEETPIRLAIVRPGATKDMTFDEIYALELQHEEQKRKLARNI